MVKKSPLQQLFVGQIILHQQTLATNEWNRQQDWGELYDRQSDPVHPATRARLTHQLVRINMATSGYPGQRSHYARRYFKPPCPAIPKPGAFAALAGLRRRRRA